MILMNVLLVCSTRADNCVSVDWAAFSAVSFTVSINLIALHLSPASCIVMEQSVIVRTRFSGTLEKYSMETAEPGGRPGSRPAAILCCVAGCPSICKISSPFRSLRHKNAGLPTTNPSTIVPFTTSPTVVLLCVRVSSEVIGRRIKPPKHSRIRPMMDCKGSVTPVALSIASCTVFGSLILSALVPGNACGVNGGLTKREVSGFYVRLVNCCALRSANVVPRSCKCDGYLSSKVE